MNNKKIAYARISDQSQNIDRQISEFLNEGINERDIYIDKQTGKNFNRDAYNLLKSHVLRKGDILYIDSIDRLGRNYREIKKEWKELTEDLGIDIKVMDMPLLNTTINKDLLGTFIRDLVIQILSYVAEKELENIKRRQKQGIEEAKKKKVKFGRKPIGYPKDWKEIYDKWQAGEITATRAMQILNLKRTTFYKLVKQYKADQEDLRDNS